MPGDGDSRGDFLGQIGSGDFGAAVKTLDELVEKAAQRDEPAGNLSALHLNRGRCYLMLELNRKALKDFSEAVHLQPSNTSALLAKGQALLRLNKRADAKAAFLSGVDAATPLTDISVLQQLHQQLGLVQQGAAPSSFPAPAASAAPPALSDSPVVRPPPPPPHPHTPQATQQERPPHPPQPAAPSASPPRQQRFPAVDSPGPQKLTSTTASSASSSASESRSSPSQQQQSNKRLSPSRDQGGATSTSTSTSGTRSSADTTAAVHSNSSSSGKSSSTSTAAKGAAASAPHAGTSGSTSTSSGGGAGKATPKASSSSKKSSKKEAKKAAGGNADFDPSKPLDIGNAINAAVTLINGGQLAKAESILDQVLDRSNGRDHTTLGAHVARGTARALGRRLKEAVEDFTAAIDLDPTFADSWKRRGQARAAMDEAEGALADLKRCMELSGSKDQKAEACLERGMIYQKQRDYRRAAVEFEIATRLTPTMSQAWNMLGLCRTSQGDIQLGMKDYKEAVRLSPGLRDAWMNMAQVLKEFGRVVDAEEAFRKATSLDASHMSNAYAFRMLAHMRQGCGDHVAAIRLLDQALSAGKGEQVVECHFLRGACQHALGHHAGAVKDYEIALVGNKEDDKDVKTEQFLSFYQKELALYAYHNLDRPVDKYCMDCELQSLFKESWCKKLPPTKELITSYSMQPPIPSRSSGPKSGASKAQVSSLVKAADPLGRLIQYHHQGFLQNLRQQRAGGLAALELAQMVRSVVFNRREGRDTWVDSEGASSSGGASGRHCFGWRDAMDIVVKWRQLSEPNDQVLWIDLLTRREFEAGFGSHTPMYSGQTKCVRYYMNFPRALELHKEVLLEAGHAFDAHNVEIPLGNQEKQDAIRAARDAADMWQVLGADSWIVVPIASTVDASKSLDGTRLTVVKMNQQPDGHEFSIRTPVTPPRWAEFDRELEAVWEKLLDAMCEGDKPKIAECILVYAYYWYHFMPLARGTAAVGYITILGLFLAAGMPVTANTPKDTQVDWEAILSRKPEEFVASVSKWLFPAAAKKKGQASGAKEDSTVLKDLPTVVEVLNTSRSRLNALNGLDTKPI